MTSKVTTVLVPEKIFELGCRDAFGMALADLGRSDENIVVLVADSAVDVGTSFFQRATKDRTFDLGIAEGNIVGFAAGMAAVGKTPFAIAYAFLLSMRACEQVRTDVAFTGFNVKLVGTYSGLIPGTDGPSHHTYEDFAIMRAMANMTVVVPADSVETYKATFAIANHPGPVYMRIGYSDEPLVYENGLDDFEIGRAITVREGNDVTLIATGNVVYLALEAAKQLETEGIDARVLDMHTIKPIDRQAVRQSSVETGALVTVEEHNVLGGLGGAVSEVLVEENPAPMVRVGIPDRFCGNSDHETLRKQAGITQSAIVKAAQDVLSRK